ncbi:three-Cys-motif partner protein TcmP [Lentzea rhizosphaerae]|uniref:Three-Cys-motif partner protein TcmP n=1 Tax=Lentzea rhizosphaerae TaxID=2041025 RepID=A0ABV8BXK2_9PSEU
MGFFDARRAPAVVKHGLLRRYCPAFAHKAGSRTGGRVTFLDGYAGAGCYDDDTPGSPLVLLEAARSVADRRDVDAVFIERDPATYARLEEVLADRCKGQPYLPLPGDVDDHLEEVMRRSNDRALFAFLDPFGPALSRERLCWLLKQRAQRRLPTDVLLHVSVRSVWNFGSRLTKAKREQRPLNAQDEAFAGHLDRFLGPDWWRSDFEDAAVVSDPTGSERIAAIALRVAQRYADAVGKETGYLPVSMPVRRRPERAPIFVLTLFTAHAAGVWLFADCIGQAGLDWEEAWRDAEASKEGPDGQMGLFSGGDVSIFDRDAFERNHEEQWISIIQSNIDKLLDERRPLVLQDHTAAVFGSTLGTGARGKHAREAVKRLYRAGQVDHKGTGNFERDRMLRPVQRQWPSGATG